MGSYISPSVGHTYTSKNLFHIILIFKKIENSKFKMADAEKYLGKFDRTSAEKYDEFLSELGVNFLLRKAATVSSPVFEVTYDAGSEEWLFKTSTTLKTMELKFKLGVEFEEKTPDGREVTAIVTKEGDTFVSIQTAKKRGRKINKNYPRIRWRRSDCDLPSDWQRSYLYTEVQETSLKRPHPKCFEFLLYIFFPLVHLLFAKKKNLFSL